MDLTARDALSAPTQAIQNDGVDFPDHSLVGRARHAAVGEWQDLRVGDARQTAAVDGDHSVPLAGDDFMKIGQQSVATLAATLDPGNPRRRPPYGLAGRVEILLGDAAARSEQHRVVDAWIPAAGVELLQER